MDDLSKQKNDMNNILNAMNGDSSSLNESSNSKNSNIPKDDLSKQTDDMNNIINAMNGNSSSLSSSLNESNNSTSDNDVGIMEKFMNALNDPASENKLDNVVKTTIKENKNNKEFNEAIVTQKTNDGAKIGNWEIKQKFFEGIKNKKIYDVIHLSTNEPIAKDLMIYEAAYSLVKLLNEGYTINDKKIKDILSLEESYSNSYHDAINFKRKSTSYYNSGQKNKGDLFEARFDKTKQNLQKTKNELKKYLKV